MADSSFGLPIINDLNLQQKSVINTLWEHQGTSDSKQYEVYDLATFGNKLYQCKLQSDASKDSIRIPTNTTYWTLIAGTSKGINSITNVANVLTINYSDSSTDTITLPTVPTVVTLDVPDDLKLTGRKIQLERSGVAIGDGVTIPVETGEVNVNADWTETDSDEPSYIENKPNLFSGVYTDLTSKPSLFSGSYNALSDKPTIPSAPLSWATVGNSNAIPEGKIPSTIARDSEITVKSVDTTGELRINSSGALSIVEGTRRALVVNISATPQDIIKNQLIEVSDILYRAKVNVGSVALTTDFTNTTDWDKLENEDVAWGDLSGRPFTSVDTTGPLSITSGVLAISPTSIRNVPAPVSTDTGKVLKVTGTNTYGWETPANETAADWAKTGNSDKLPQNKLPSDVVQDSELTTKLATKEDTLSAGTGISISRSSGTTTVNTSVDPSNYYTKAEANVEFLDSSEVLEFARDINTLVPDSQIPQSIARDSEIPTKTSEIANDSGFLTSALQQSDVTVNGSVLVVGTLSFDPAIAAGNSESVVAWLKNSGSKVFNFVGGELSSFTITATDASVWTQALNFTAGDLTSITYTHDSGNESVWEDTVITKTFNYTNGELSSIDYDRS